MIHFEIQDMDYLKVKYNHLEIECQNIFEFLFENQ